jgi:hypothetical protein
VKKIQKINLLLLIGIFLLSTIGINVFEHICRKDGTSVSYIIPIKHHCKKVKEVKSCCVKKEKSCCSTTKNEKQISTLKIQEKCCSDKISTFKLKCDFEKTTSEKINIAKSHYFNDYSKFDNQIIYYAENFHSFHSPPPIWRKSEGILIFNQVFRI